MFRQATVPTTNPTNVPTVPIAAPVIRKTRITEAHGAQDRDIAALVLHQHDQAGNDVQRRDQHDQGQDQKLHVALGRERGSESDRVRKGSSARQL